LDFDEVDGLHQAGSGQKERGVHNAASSWDDLAPAAIDGMAINECIKDLELDIPDRYGVRGS
jgi:hypothetical protein